MESVTLGDVTLAYEVSGPDNGEVVVLICGCGGPAAGWFALTSALVEAGYRVVTFDNRGVAPSSAPSAPYTIDAMVGDVLGLSGYLGIDRAHFVGHSMGGWITEVLAADHPHRVRSATMMGSCNATTAWERVVTLAERDAARLFDVPTPMMSLADLLRYLPNQSLQDNATVEAWEALLADEEPWTNPGRLGQYEACLGWYERDAEHAAARPAIAVPCLVMAFEHDIDSPPAYARVAAAEIPNARYAEIADASHIAPYTHPDAVARLLLEFLISL